MKIEKQQTEISRSMSFKIDVAFSSELGYNYELPNDKQDVLVTQANAAINLHKLLTNSQCFQNKCAARAEL